jgi:parallel beta-helix repeat protein
MKRLIILLMALLIAAPDVFPQRAGVGVGVGFKQKKKSGNGNAVDPAAYYVNSKTGSDSNNGFTPATAFASITKVNTLDLTGTRYKVLFAKGDTLSGTITPGQSGTSGKRIIYGAYGTGANPVITGFTTVTGWTKRSNTNVYVKKVTATTRPELFTINGVQMALGRTPNSYRYNPQYADYYHIDSHSSTTSITDAECNSATTNWNGAELVFRTDNDMNWARCPITAHSGTTLTITNSFAIGDGYGYFIQNDLRTLDQYGEWYFNNTTDTLYCYFGAAGPGSAVTKLSTTDVLANTGQRNYITFQNIDFEGANADAYQNTYGYKKDNITITNCNFNLNNRAVYAYSTVNFEFTGCNITNCCYMGVYNHYWSEGAYIASNTVDSTGLVIGCGTGDGSYIQGTGIYSAYGRHRYTSEHTIIEKNTILNSGYNGIWFGSDSAIVRNNYINKYNLNKSDGGAIYTGIRDSLYKGMTIDNNICLNGTESNDKYGQPLNTVVNAAYNIYIDYSSSGGITISDNTTAHTKGAGIMVHMSKYVTITGNTIYDCTVGVKFQEQSGYSNSTIRNIDMQNNIIVSKKSAQKAVSARSLADDFNQFGTINNNKFAKPLDKSPVFITMINSWTETVRDSASWRTATTWDANSTFGKIQIQNDDSVRFYTNPTASAVVYALNDTLRDAAGTYYNTSVTVPAYYSKVLWNDDLVDYTPKLLGVQTVGGTAFSATTRMGMPVTFTENGTITAIVIYSSGQLVSGGNILLGVYDNTGSTGLPGSKLAETNIQETQTFAGWLRINLKTPLAVTNGQTVWLCWVAEESIQLWYATGTPGRAQTTGTDWSHGLPSTFGTSTQAGSKYSIYCIYKLLTGG